MAITLDVQLKGSETVKQLQTEIAALRAEMDKLGKTTDDTSKKESGLAAYRKEQTKEMKNYRFVVGEMRDAIGGVSLGLSLLTLTNDKASSSTKQMTNVVNTGFAAFSAMDAVMGPLEATLGKLPGAMGLIITAGAGVVGALIAIANEAEATKRRIVELNNQTLEINVKLGIADTSEFINVLKEEVGKAEKELARLQQEVRNTVVSRATGVSTTTVSTEGSAEDIATQKKLIAEKRNLLKEALTAQEADWLKMMHDRNAAEMELDIVSLDSSIDILQRRSAFQRNNSTDRYNFELSLVEQLGLSEKEARDYELRIALENQERKRVILLNYQAEKAKIEKENLEKESDARNTAVVGALKTQSDILLAYEKNANARIDIEERTQLSILEKKRKAALASATIEQRKAINIEFDAKGVQIAADATLKRIKLEEDAKENIRRIQQTIVDIHRGTNNSIVLSHAEGMAQRLKAERDFAVQSIQLERSRAISEASLRGATSAEIEAINALYNAKILAANKTAIDKRSQNEIDAAIKVTSLKADAMQEGEDKVNAQRDVQKAAEIKAAEDTIANTEQLEQAKAAIEEKYRLQKEQADKDATARIATATVDGLKTAYLAINDAFTASSQARVSRLEVEKEDGLKRLDDERAARLAIFDAELENDFLTTAQRKKLTKDRADAEKKALAEKKSAEDKYNEQLRAAKTDAWKAEHRAKLAMATADVAHAIIVALAGGPPPFNAIAAGITAAAAAVQLGIIASQEVPKFHTGGIVGAPALRPDERLLIGQVGETIRTPKQEAALASSMGNYNLYITFTSPVTEKEMVARAIKQMLVDTGKSVGEVFVNNNSTISLG